MKSGQKKFFPILPLLSTSECICRHSDEKLNPARMSHILAIITKFLLTGVMKIILSRIQLHSQRVKTASLIWRKPKKKTYESIYEKKLKKKGENNVRIQWRREVRRAKIYRIKRCYLYRFWSKSHFNDD